MKLSKEGQATVLANMGLVGDVLRRFYVACPASLRDDLKQSLCATLCRVVHYYRPDGGAKLSTYAMRSLFRTAMDFVRSIPTEYELNVFDIAVTDPEWDGTPLYEECTRYVSERVMYIIEEHTIRGKTFRQIALEMNLSEGTVFDLYKRNVKKLRRELCA